MMTRSKVEQIMKEELHNFQLLYIKDISIWQVPEVLQRLNEIYDFLNVDREKNMHQQFSTHHLVKRTRTKHD